jgi:hypothetical protein
MESDDGKMKRASKIPALVIIAAICVFIFCASFSFFVLDHTPRIHDEIAYVFQAKIFLSGLLFAPSPSPRSSFDFPHIVNNGRWYAQYPPGWPLLLTLGLLIGTPWLINPILAALAIIVIFYLGTELFSIRIGTLAAFLGSVSIWSLVISSSMMSHTSSMFFMTLFLLFMFRSIRHPTPINGIIAAAGLGMMLLIRPLDSVLVSIPFLIYYGFQWSRKQKTGFKNLLAFVLTMCFILGILLTYNFLTNGHPLKMGYMVYLGEGRGLGFGAKIYQTAEHNPFLGRQNIAKNLTALNKYLFGWPFSSFLALVPLLFIRRRKKDILQKDLLLACGFLSQTVGLFFYWGAFVFISPRLFFSTFPLLILLSARGIYELKRALDTRNIVLMPIRSNTILELVIIVFTAYAFLITLPQWVKSPKSEWFFERMDHHFAGVNPDIHKTIKRLVPPKSLVIFKFLYVPYENFPTGWWSSGFLNNMPDLKGDIIYAMDTGEGNNRLFQCFPDRNIFMFVGVIDKGMLFPMYTNDAQVTLGPNYTDGSIQQNRISILQDPRQFYTVYSEEFSRTIEKVYSEHPVWQVDASLLANKGKEAFNRHEYSKAMTYVEAALQIEKQPYVRFKLLNLLGICYFKAGIITKAKRVQSSLQEKNILELYDIIPERGF